jgi:hypothetical protein
MVSINTGEFPDDVREAWRQCLGMVLRGEAQSGEGYSPQLKSLLEVIFYMGVNWGIGKSASAVRDAGRKVMTSSDEARKRAEDVLGGKA